MGPNYVPGEKNDLYVESVKRTVIWMGKKQETVEDVPCGNTVALFGLNASITRSATVTDEKETEAHPLCAMIFIVSPVVCVTVSYKVDLNKLVDGLRRLAKSDPLVVCTIEKSGEHVIACAGELHLEICLKDLQDDFMGGAEIVVSERFATLTETVLEIKSSKVMIKSANGHLLMKARQLDASLVYAIENGQVGPSDDPVARGKILSERFVLEKYVGKEIWCFGPERNGPNMVVDMGKCKGVQNLNEIKDSVIAGFKEVSKKGVLAGESMMGIFFEVHGAHLDADPAHPDGSEMFEIAKCVMYASQLTALPRFMQPFYMVEFQAREEDVEKICSLMRNRRGTVEEKKKTQRSATELVYYIWGFMPVTESFGFAEELKNATSQELNPQSMFQFWEMMRSDPLKDGSYSSKFLSQIRKRKGLKEQITPLSDFEDKL